MALQVGDKAPAFTLFNTDKKPVSLSDYSGKNVVVLFFPLAFTGVCTKFIDAFRIFRNSSLNAGRVDHSVRSKQNPTSSRPDTQFPDLDCFAGDRENRIGQSEQDANTT